MEESDYLGNVPAAPLQEYNLCIDYRSVMNHSFQLC